MTSLKSKKEKGRNRRVEVDAVCVWHASKRHISNMSTDATPNGIGLHSSLPANALALRLVERLLRVHEPRLDPCTHALVMPHARAIQQVGQRHLDAAGDVEQLALVVLGRVFGDRGDGRDAGAAVKGRARGAVVVWS